MSESYFRVRLHRPYLPENDARVYPETFAEPVEAVDFAEEILRKQGIPDQSWCDLLFNGDTEPHTSVFKMKGQRYGIWNREGVPWPVYYDPEEGYGAKGKLEFHPRNMAEGEDTPKKAEADEAEKGKKSDEAEKMKLDGQDDSEDEPDTDAEIEEEGDDYEEDWPEGEDDEGANSDDEDEDAEGDEEEPEADSGDEDEDENDDEGDEEDGMGDGGDDGEDAGDGDGDGDSESDSEKESEDESEKEQDMPRLNIFAKMRGPKGWRKRAEIEELNTRNVFGLKIGVVNDEGKTPGQQEKNVRCEIQFIEDADMKQQGILRIRAHDDLTFTRKGGWFVAEIPYYDEDA